MINPASCECGTETTTDESGCVTTVCKADCSSYLDRVRAAWELFPRCEWGDGACYPPEACADGRVEDFLCSSCATLPKYTVFQDTGSVHGPTPVQLGCGHPEILCPR